MLCAGCIIALAQSLYTTDFLTEEDFNAWTVIDANEDGTTWKFDSEASTSFVKISIGLSIGTSGRARCAVEFQATVLLLLILED